MTTIKFFFFLVFSLFLHSICTAQSPVGTWKTIDDETGQAKSYVDISENNGKLVGKISRLLLKPADTICDKCRDDKKNKPVLGMVIVDNLFLKDGFYQGGSILDPNKGDYYKCSLWLDAGDKNVLNVKGKHWTGLSRTQKWYRVQ
ncbi:MAG: DUF2147 domain-containing protein [Saprospiraceae bacterium]